MKAEWLDAIARMPSRKPKISTYFGFKLKLIATMILPINRDPHGLHQNKSWSVDDHRKLLLFCERKMKAPFLVKVLKLPSWERRVENVEFERSGVWWSEAGRFLFNCDACQSQKRMILSTRWTDNLSADKWFKMKSPPWTTRPRHCQSLT